MGKRTILWAVLAGSVAIFAQGCSYEDILQTREYESETSQEREAGTEYRPEKQEDEDKQQADEVPELYYAYHCLEAERQEIYLEMLDSLKNMEQDTLLSTTDRSVLDPVFACVMNDHPELFYVEGYQYTEYTFDGAVTSITFSGTYSMTEEEAEETAIRIEQKLQECFSQAPQDGDEYGTVKFLYEWLINHTEYDKTAENNQNICSVFLQGRSVCQGYAKAMQYMLQKAGIQCFLVTGFTNGERHGWNLAKVNDAYYYLDPTWGDASYAFNGGNSPAEGFAPSINYDYFLVTTDEVTRTHSLERVVELPQCTAVKDNYFVREGLYFEDYDAQRLAGIFAGDAARAAGCVTIKCGSDESYGLMVQNLIDLQKIFDFISKQTTSIAYTSNEKQRTISFWNIY